MSDTPAPTRGVRLELGGKVLYLRYSLRVRRELIAKLGGADKFSELAGEQIAEVLLAGARASTPDLTIEWLEDEIDMLNIRGVVDKMCEALGVSKPKLVVGEEEPTS